MANASPIFLYGALRSGTTVFRLMLKAHSQVRTPGEVDYLFDHIHQTEAGWRFDLEALRDDWIFQRSGLEIPDVTATDGAAVLNALISQYGAAPTDRVMLTVHRHMDKITALFPQAPIVRLLRDPRDVARSAIGMGWAGTPFFGVRLWIATERAWDRAASAIDPDRVLTLRYEDLIRDVEGRLRDVCAFVGLAFEPAMLRYHEGTTYGPPDVRLIEQWRTRLTSRDLALVEGRLGPLLQSRGYEASGVAPFVPGKIRHRMLHLADRWQVFRFNVRRHGIRLVVAERVTRRLGMTSRHRAALVRLHQSQVRFLK